MSMLNMDTASRLLSGRHRACTVSTTGAPDALELVQLLGRDGTECADVFGACEGVGIVCCRGRCEAEKVGIGPAVLARAGVPGDEREGCYAGHVLKMLGCRRPEVDVPG